ncbi:MAG: hypothetical protein DWQ36_17895 [Acidobacteria bacterium]|nr:MAG: hypothetical protein DWQ30_15655 [Acidobacteriota bacterium]REK04309.1 MAG: hypothetical protein DWQ36_17895 [Acidobacteriota bacterium]
MTVGERSAIRAQPTVVPEPGNAWVRYRFAERWWPAAARAWTDLGRGELRGDEPTSKGESRAAGGRLFGLGFERAGYDDVLYLPPVADALRPWRLRLARDLLRAGAPVCLHLLPGDPVAETGSRQALLEVRDLTEVLLPPWPAGEGAAGALAAALDAEGQSLRGGWALVPILAGITAPDVEAIGGLLRGAGARGVLAVAPRLDPTQRRRLSEATGDAYEALFHRPAVDLDAALDQLESLGLSTLPTRPLPPAPERLRQRREGAGLLMTVAELQRRRGAVPSRVQELVRSALWLERNDLDLPGSLREGNLRLVEQVSDEARALLAAWIEEGMAAVLARHGAPGRPGC